MLVLSRKVGEQVFIGSDIVVTVLEVQGQRVKIGIDAPRHCRVLRGELMHRHDVAAGAIEAPAPPIIAWLPAATDDALLAVAR